MKRHYRPIIGFIVICLISFSGVLGAAQETGSDEAKQQDSITKRPTIHVVPKNQPMPLQPPQSSGKNKVQPPQIPTPKDKPQVPSRQLPPELPSSTIPQDVSREQPHEVREGTLSDLATQVLTRKLGAERVQQILNSIHDTAGEGAPNASTYFDGAHVLNGTGELMPGEQTRFFQGSRPAAHEPVPAGNYNYKITTVQDSSDITKDYGSIPGGVVLDGQADVGPIENITYDSRFNAFIVNDQAVYFLKVSPRIVVELCRALSQKDKIGVSIGTVQISYGALPKKSQLARDLMLTDHFLGSIAFGWKDWTTGYIFANGYEPQQFHGSMRAAVFFRFSGFQFRVEQQEFNVVQENFEDRFIPLSDRAAGDGGSLPDEAAILEGNVPREWEMNLRHIAENMSYYRREKLINQTFSYGAAAAFLRGMKAQDVDLAELARVIEGELSSGTDNR
jgi:hypothetical protein